MDEQIISQVSTADVTNGRLELGPPAKRVRLDMQSLWAMLPASLDRMLAAERAATNSGEMMMTSVSAATPKTSQGVAVVQVYGALSQKGCFWCDTLGMETLGSVVESLAADDTVSAILLEFDSPGGTYAGTMEAAAKIKAACDKKRVWAIANSMAASAAYWLASSCDKFFCTPSGEVGSIGVVAVHYDLSALNEKIGVKPTYVTYGDNKAEFNSDSPLSSESQAELQKRVNEAGEAFVKAVASNRKVSQSTVKDSFGQGRMFSASEAARRGMIDGVDTIDGVIALLTGKKPINGGRKATMERKRLDLKRYE